MQSEKDQNRCQSVRNICHFYHQVITLDFKLTSTYDPTVYDLISNYQVINNSINEASRVNLFALNANPL